jgi:DNA-binding CsgD family transcriptional regulator
LEPYFAVLAAWACDDLGRPVDATVPADAQLLPITRPLVAEVEAVRLLSSDPSAAADLLAAASAESRQYSYGQAVREAWGAAEAARRAGRTDAVDLLLAVEEEAIDAGLAPIVARARRSLRLAGVVRTSERSIDRTGLVSPREREVLELVAAGLTNNEIARRLGVGRPTVRRLTDRARAKLGARDRVEAAAILARRDPAG